ncbi:hypothetical protein H9Y05_11820 [Crocinitomicaceae bacterium CZZ-1]|uniref:Uncharacterized protein n=1 Tax=Taishania pollutisoli TaxID=2766479 RepID=A0A8J6PKC9_9FLAO|nr:hypothetical protein [Taishania pollutisoli]MBC9813154.1 hypothetical protein [Taishania pollutisoli]
MNVSTTLSRFILFFVIAIISCRFTSAQDETGEKTPGPYYIKDLSGTIHHYDKIKLIMSRYHCYEGEVVVKIYPYKEVLSGFTGFDGRQFLFGNIKKGALVKGRKKYMIEVNDHGKMILSYTTSNATVSYYGSSTAYYVCINNKVTRVPILAKNISGWENIFTGCPGYESIIKDFNSRKMEEYWGVQEIISALSSVYYRDYFEEY